MHIRATIVCSCLLSLACGPGPGDATDTAATTGGTTTTDTTTTGGPTTGGPTTGDPTTSGSSGDTTASGTTGTTGDTTTDATSATTGAPLCEGIVGSRDCAALVAVSPDLTMETCTKCQGLPCGQEPECDAEFPCVDGAIVIQGCCTDDECDGLSPFCGMFIGINNVCVNSDDV